MTIIASINQLIIAFNLLNPIHYYTDSFLLEQITILPNRLSTIDRTLRRRKKNEEEEEEMKGKKK